MDNKMLTFSSEIKGIDEKEQTLTAYVSTGARDRMNEVLDPAGIDMSNYKKNPVVLWAHDYTKPPIGKAMWIKKDGVGVLSKVKFDCNISLLTFRGKSVVSITQEINLNQTGTNSLAFSKISTF